MKLGEIYRLAIEAGREADPRGPERLEKVLADVKAEFEEMAEEKREFFDVERLTNLYRKHGLKALIEDLDKF